ncbi:TPA: hypothetical protein QDB06_000750 [Burkholderia vietnamiensis]|nr:hypothetical protein [Burkholderia vietnamiensis]
MLENNEDTKKNEPTLEGMEQHKNAGPSTKHKIIAALVVAGIVGLVFFRPHHSMKVEVAQTVGQKAEDKLKAKIQDIKDKRSEKASSLQADKDQDAAQRGIVQHDAASSNQNVLKNVDSKEYISVDNLSIKTGEADILLMNAITAGDLDRVSYLLKSGISTDFTDDAVCFYNDRNHTVQMPNNLVDARNLIKFNVGGFFATTVCSKLFLYNSAMTMKKMNYPGSYFYYHNGYDIHTPQEIKDNDQKTLAFEQRKVDIFHILMGRMNKKDNESLAPVFTMDTAPYDIRKEALDAYLANLDSVPVSENRKKFTDLMIQAVSSINDSDPKSGEKLMNALSDSSSRYFMLFAQQYMTAATNYDIQVGGAKTTMKMDPKKAGLELPLLSVESLKAGTIAHHEDSSSVFWVTDLAGKRPFAPLYELNNSISLIATMVDSHKVNLNYQDNNGDTILHKVVQLNIGPNNARAMAVLVRYLLNSGANPSLLNKAGKTPLMILSDKISAMGGSQQGIGEVEEVNNAFTNKDYN